MLFELISHLMAFDLIWVVNLVLGNLHWVFALFAFSFIAEKGKRPIWHFLVIVIFLYAFVDLMDIGGWILASMLIITVFQISLGLFFEKGTWPEKNFVKIVTVAILALSFINTFYFTIPG